MSPFPPEKHFMAVSVLLVPPSPSLQLHHQSTHAVRLSPVFNSLPVSEGTRGPHTVDALHSLIVAWPQPQGLHSSSVMRHIAQHLCLLLISPLDNHGALPLGLGHPDKTAQPHCWAGTDQSWGEQQWPAKMRWIILQAPLLQLVLLLAGAQLWSHPVFLWPGLERKAFSLSPSSVTTSGKSLGNEPRKRQDPWP